MNANFACTLDHVVARRSAAVWRHGAEDCSVGSLLRLGGVGSPSWLSCCCGCFVVGCGCGLVVVRGFVMLILRSSYDIF